MCLLANECEQTATEDRTVYKVIWKDNCSEYQGFQYEAGGRYQLNEPLVLRPYAGTGWPLPSVHEGFHAFRSLETAVYNHAHRRQKKVVAFIIPKDAHYVLGIGDDIVSDAIIAGTLEELCA